MQMVEGVVVEAQVGDGGGERRVYGMRQMEFEAVWWLWCEAGRWHVWTVADKGGEHM